MSISSLLNIFSRKITDHIKSFSSGTGQKGIQKELVTLIFSYFGAIDFTANLIVSFIWSFVKFLINRKRLNGNWVSLGQMGKFFQIYRGESFGGDTGKVFFTGPAPNALKMLIFIFEYYVIKYGLS